MRLVDIILPLAIRDCYTYSVPDSLSIPAPGTRVVVPLMKKEVRGIVLREHTEPIEESLLAKIRPILSVSESAPMVTKEQLALWQWMSEYYLCSLGEVMSAALPQGLDKRLLNPPKRSRATLKPYTGPIDPAHVLSAAQQKNSDEIETFWTSGKDIVLLHGVTSSGKTDIYIHLIEAQLAAGKNVLYLVPEIALTTQLTSRLQRIFGDRLIVYHSRFTDAEREKRYKQISAFSSQHTENYVVLGARSAVFLPVSDIGLVIVDEEHDPSYKQAEPAPRYHARAAAIVLAKSHQAKVLLGSATPSVESYYLAQKGVYGLVTLTERFGGVELPQISLIDLRRQYERKEMYGHFSDPLVDTIRQCLADHKQVILFQNRRGYAPQLQCLQCGQPPRCVQCDVPMTMHKQANEMRCHYCGYRSPIPTICPTCGGEMKAVGFGTERIEDEIQTLFPEARVLRMDLDTTRNKDAYQDIINSFANHECDILVGTQMITKGLHFDDVRLVAVLNADPLFNQPDFRAYERAFQMLEQVAGRAGRKGTKGEVIIQTFDPSNAVLEMVRRHDYSALYEQQIAERKTFRYPPFHRIIRLQMRDHNSVRVHTAATQLQQYLTRIFGTRVSEVIIPNVERVQAYTIRELTLRIEAGANMAEAKRRLREAIDHVWSIPSNKNTKLIIDIDPL
ncbi:MAG: primosomal protein N' [Paludibacteraceae bacterium]|nr:primosomal protein N' [Paludibacteraceae bacterium]